VSDLLFMAIIVGFFLLAALFVRACDRIIGAEEAPATSTPAEAPAEREPVAA
jgi:hypothetical protein